MKTNNKLIIPSVATVFVMLFLSVFYSCEIQDDFEYENADSSGKLGVDAWKFIQSNDSLQLFEEAIEKTGLQKFYEDAATKTFIAPTNEAFKEYLQTNSYSTLDDIPVPILRNALRYHIVDARVIFTDPELSDSNNPLPYKTENGQTMYLSHNTNYQGLVNQGTNKQFTIVTSNLEPTNGVMHVVSSIVYFSAPSKDPDTPDPSIKTDTIFPIADTYVNGGNKSGDNFGADKLLKMKNVSGDGLYDRKVFLMFDLKDLKKEGVVTDLKLELAVKFTHGKGVNIGLYNVKDTLWTEMGLSFDNATFPDDDPIANLTSSKMNSFDFNITDFFKALDNKGRISFMLDAEEGSDETDEFASKENTDFNIPMLIATIGTGNNNLEVVNNSGINVEQGGAVTFNNDILEVTGTAAADIIFTLEEVPQPGWLVKGANILQAGAKFTQEDINVMNLLYINDGTGTQDKIVLSGKDRTGSSLEAFDVEIAIE